MNSVNKNVLANELQISMQKIDQVKELIEREIRKNKQVQYSEKRNKKFGKMLSELSRVCEDFKDKWGKELHYL